MTPSSHPFGVRRDLEYLWESTRIAADIAAIDFQRSKPRMVEAAVRAAFECALTNGLITVVPDEDRPERIVIR